MTPLLETPVEHRERAIRCFVYNDDTKPHTLDDLEEISEIIKAERGFVWLDIAEPTADDLALLQREFDIHPVAIEDASLWHERPKIEFFPEYVLTIAHAAGLDATGGLVTHEVAILAGRNYVITLRAYPLYALEEIEHRRAVSRSVPSDATGLLYIILDAMVDSYFPITEAYDDRLVRLESRLFDADKSMVRTEREIFAFKRSLTVFRSVVTPMREVMLRLTHTEIEPLQPGLSLYFRDVHDHVMRALEQIDITRDLVNSTLDFYLASQSHKQNEVSKQLTIIATVFLPLTYITGFFGQNFGWMVNGITSPHAFWWLGVGSQLATLAILVWFFKSRRWI